MKEKFVFIFNKQNNNLFKKKKIIQKFSILHYYICSLDINAKNKNLYLCGIPKDTSKDIHPYPGFKFSFDRFLTYKKLF